MLKPIKKCKNCGVPIKGRRINCSKKCQNQSLRNGVILICEYCQKDFYVNQSTLTSKKCRFCSANCHYKWKKDSGAFKGEKNPRWNNGATKEKAKIRASEEYMQWRTAVFERDKYTCVWCGAISKKGKKVYLHADHIKPFSYFPELRFKLENGRTLCTNCHRLTASYLGRARTYYEKKKFKPGIDRIEYGGIHLGPEEHDAIFQTLFTQKMKRWTIGPESEALERELAEKVGMKRAVLVNSGSSALLVAISALKLPKGSKVLISGLTFPTAYSSIMQADLVPVVIDCDLESLNLSFKQVKKALKMHPDIKAVVAINIAGNLVDLPKLRNIIGSDRKLVLDNCDGFGSKLNGQYIDKYADVSCASFHAAHIIGMGEGGGIFTDDEKLAEVCRKKREWGRESGSDKITKIKGFPPDYRERYVFTEIGWNLKPLELQCAMGRIQLKKLEYFVERRRDNYYKLRTIIEKIGKFDIVKCDVNGEYTCWFGFPFLCRDIERKTVMDYLESKNIETRTIFSGNILKHPAYKGTGIQIGNLKNCNYVMAHGMFISNHPSLTGEQLNYIGKVLKELCS